MRPPTFSGGGENGATRTDEEALLLRTLKGLVTMQATFVGQQIVETDIRGDPNSIANRHLMPKVGETVRGSGKTLTQYEVRAESVPFTVQWRFIVCPIVVCCPIAHRVISYRLP